MSNGTFRYSFTTYRQNGTAVCDSITDQISHDMLKKGINSNTFNQIVTKDYQDATHLGFGIAYNKNNDNWILAINKKWWKESPGVDFVPFAVKRYKKDIKKSIMHNISDIIKRGLNDPDVAQPPVNIIFMTSDEDGTPLYTLCTMQSIPAKRIDNTGTNEKMEYEDKYKEAFEESVENFKNRVFNQKTGNYDDSAVNEYYGISEGSRGFE